MFLLGYRQDPSRFTKGLIEDYSALLEGSALIESTLLSHIRIG